MITHFFIKLRLFSLFLALTFLFIACGSPSDESEPDFVPPDMHNSMIALDWAGTYHGVLPCADCEGIDTKIILRDDLSYQKEKIYLGKSEEVYLNYGTFSWSEDGNRIRLHDLNPAQTPGLYHVGENRLFQLDIDGNRIEGRLADHYMLPRVIDNLSGLQWELIELNGRNIHLNHESLQIPTLHFSAVEKSISGSGSCNRYNGSYEIKSGNMIHFTGIASTRIGCENMEIEQSFFELFDRAGQYSLNHDTLSFSNSSQAYLARFLLKDE